MVNYEIWINDRVLFLAIPNTIDDVESYIRQCFVYENELNPVICIYAL
jgi:hypothetical protein